MKIILLSGGSGKRLWPLSNDARSKQFLKMLESPCGGYESMVQRTMRQIRAVGLDASVTVATSITQVDSIVSQLGSGVNIVTEPARRDTFPAIALSAEFLSKDLHCAADEVVVVMPSDTYTDVEYFKAIAKMVAVVESNSADIALMGVKPREVSDKYGYIIPRGESCEGVMAVEKFIEKPSLSVAAELLESGAMWNCGVFAFRLGYVLDRVNQYVAAESFAEVRARFMELPKISFDYEVVERAHSVAVVPFDGEWHDIGSWDALVGSVGCNVMGEATLSEGSENCYVFNELNMPIMCLGMKNAVIAASPDGILVSDLESSAELKNYADKFSARPMYEERRWGTYKVLGQEVFDDGYKALTKLLCLKAGCNISYQYHNNREEIWTFVDGEGTLVLDGEVIAVSRGYVAHIKAGQKHAVRAITDLQIIEVQSGCELVEEDIIRMEWDWA